MLLYLYSFFAVNSNLINKSPSIGVLQAQYFWLDSDFHAIFGILVAYSWIDFSYVGVQTRKGLMLLIRLTRWGCGWIDSTPSSATALSDPSLTLVPQRLIDPVGSFNRLADKNICGKFSNSLNHHIICDNNVR